MNMENNLIATRYCLDNEEINFYQREEDLKNNPETSITVTNSGNEPYIIERKVEFQTSVTLQQAVERLCEELKSDEDYYRYWKDNIAMAFKDEFWKNVSVENMIGDNVYEVQLSNDNVHTIANKVADNFLKQLIG